MVVKMPVGGEKTYKDANEALLDGADLMQYIKSAKSINEQNILRISDMQDSIMSRILNQEDQQGIKSKYFKWYNRLIKGFRRGELSSFTRSSWSCKNRQFSPYKRLSKGRIVYFYRTNWIW